MPQGIPPHGSQHLIAQDLTGLARAALAGSRDERDRFLDACWQYAYSAAMRFGRRHHGAEDSAQDAVVVVQGLLDTKPPALRPETVGAFVSVVVLRSVRTAASHRAHEASAAKQTATARETANAAVDVETAEWAGRVRDAVNGLPQALRRLIDLRYWDDLSTREIAREIGRSQRSIIRLLREAETVLKKALRGLEGIDDGGDESDPRRQGRA